MTTFAIRDEDALPMFRVTIANLFTGEGMTVDRFGKDAKDAVRGLICTIAFWRGQEPDDWAARSVSQIQSE